MKYLIALPLWVFATVAHAGSMSMQGTGTIFTPNCSQSASFFTRAATNIAAALVAGASGILNWEVAIDGLICGQVTGGTWSLKDDEVVTVAPTLALAEMNLVSSSFTLLPGSSMVFTANAGLTGVANMTGYADTGYAPSSGQMTTSSSLIGACVLNNRTTLMASTFLGEVGTQTSGGASAFMLDILTWTTTSQATGFANNGSSRQTFSTTTLPTTQGGFWSSRTATSSFSDYHNGTLLGSQGGATAVALAGVPNFLALGLNDNGTARSPGGLTDTLGAFVLGGGETTVQVEADEALFTTALQAMGISSGC
jgi:hypothetical protein